MYSTTVVNISRTFLETRIAKISPRPWSKISSMSTRESEHPSTATLGNCFTMSVRLSSALPASRLEVSPKTGVLLRSGVLAKLRRQARLLLTWLILHIHLTASTFHSTLQLFSEVPGWRRPGAL